MTKDLPAGITLRPATAGEMPPLLATTLRAFGEDVRAETAALEIAAMPPEQSLAALDGTDIVASAGFYSFEMTVPGGPAPVAGVTWVGVLPTHRRRGILTAMMRHQLTDLHERGAEPVAALWASQAGIYRRFGYGLASRRLSLKIESRLAFVPGAPAVTPPRFVQLPEALDAISTTYNAMRVGRPGMTSRSPERWNALLDDAEHMRDGASALNCVVLEDGSGYVVYRTKAEWQGWTPNGKVVVRDFVAHSPQAYASLWRFLLDIDLMTTVEAHNRPVDEPLQHLVTDFHRAQPTLGEALWVRLVDVERALLARTYAQSGTLVIEVLDDTCPWNAGRFALAVEAADAAGVSVTRTDATADITVPAAVLGGAFLGGIRLRSLAAAGLVDEHTAGAVLRADRMFAGPVEPWCAEVF